MKKILVLLLITPLFAFSQNSPYSVNLRGADTTHHRKPTRRDTLKVARFSAGLSFCEQDCYRYLRADPAYAATITYRNSTEIAKYGFTSGMNFAYRVNENLALESGAWFSNQGYQVSASASSSSFTLNYNYLTLPLKANICIPLEGSSVYLSVGLAANISIGQEAEDGGIGINSTLNPQYFPNFTWANLATLLGIGSDIRISQIAYLKIEPNFMRSFTPAVNGNVKEYMYSVGLNIALFIYP